MKFLFAVFMMVLAFASLTFAADCTVGGRGFNRGQKYTPRGQCIEYTCSGKNKLSAINCAYSPTPRGCRTVPEDLSKQYPQCCSRVVC